MSPSPSLWVGDHLFVWSQLFVWLHSKLDMRKVMFWLFVWFGFFKGWSCKTQQGFARNNRESSLKISCCQCGPLLTIPLLWAQCSAGWSVMVSMRLFSVIWVLHVCYFFRLFMQVFSQGSWWGVTCPSFLSFPAGWGNFHPQANTIVSLKNWQCTWVSGSTDIPLLQFVLVQFFTYHQCLAVLGANKWHVFCECVPMLLVTLFSVLNLNKSNWKHFKAFFFFSPAVVSQLCILEMCFPRLFGVQIPCIGYSLMQVWQKEWHCTACSLLSWQLSADLLRVSLSICSCL